MKKYRLNTYRLAKENIRRKPFRSFVFIFLILLFSFAMLTGTVLSTSLSAGVESLSDRLGADVMVVPAGYETNIDSILLSGKPSNFYLPADSMDKLKNIDGIEKMSPQTYIATLSASCCSYPVQIMGIDFETDFLIKPWLTKTLNRDLEYGEVIVGSHIAGESGQKLMFFGNTFDIAGRLEQTGMGFDATVFMTRETAITLAKSAERIMMHPLSKDGSLISTVMVKLKPGYDSVQVAREITDKYASEGLFGMFSKKFVNTISANLKIITKYVHFTIIAVWVLAFFVIGFLFSVMLGERKKELAVLRTLGATKSKLMKMIMLESLIISLYGALIGTVLAILAIVFVSPFMVDALKIPFLLPNLSTLVFITITCFALAILTGPVASLYSALKISKIDVYQTMRAND